MNKPTNRPPSGSPPMALLQTHTHGSKVRYLATSIPLNRPPGTFLLAALLVLGAIGCDREQPMPTDMAGSTSAPAANFPPLLDDYSNDLRNHNGAERLLIDDKTAGGQSRATVKCEGGVLSVNGDLVPGRGVPAFISVVSPLSADGMPKNLTGYEGVRLRVKVRKGILSVQVATATIANFDFHTGAPIAGKGGGFQEVRIPFGDMKRAWSEQTALDLKAVTSVNLVSFGLSRDTFAYEVDEIGFY